MHAISQDIVGRSLKNNNNSSRKMLGNEVLSTAGVLGCVGKACSACGVGLSQMEPSGKSSQIINFLRLTDAIPGDLTS